MPTRVPLFALVVLAATLVAPPVAPAQEVGAVAEAVLDPGVAAEQLEAARAALAGVPEDAAADSAEGERGAALRRRVALLEEFAALAAELDGFEQTRSGLDERLAEARRALEALDAQPEPEAPDAIGRDAYEALEAEVAEQRERVSALRAAATAATRRVEEELPQIQESLAARADEAEKRAGLISQRLAGATDEAARGVLELGLENARLDLETAREAATVRAEEARLLSELEPVADAEIDLAESRLARLEARLTLAADALAGELARERATAEAELAARERAAEEATDPAERFVAEREARVARSRKNAGDAQSALLSLNNEVTEQERRLATEQGELNALRELINQPGTSGMAEERIRITLQQAKLRRQLLERAMRRGIGGSMNEYRARRFTIDDTLFGIVERFEAERAAVLEAVPEAQRGAFERRTDQLLRDLRAALREEKSALTELIALGQQVQKLYLDRLDVLGELERFIRSRAFWLRDGRPLGPAVLAPLPAELGRLGDWLHDLVAAETWTPAGRAGRTGLLYALALLLLVPVALLWLRQRLRAATRRINDRVLAEGRRGTLLVLATVTGVLSAAVFPAYLVIAARSLAGAGLPASVGPVLVTGLEHLGFFLFAWFLMRSFFARRSSAEVLFEMPHEAANAFYSAVRWLLLAYGALLIPWILLSEPPFEFVALARIAYLGFLAMSAYGVLRLVRPASPFVRYRLASVGAEFVSAHWRTIANVVGLLAVAVVVLDAAGFRYAARSIGTSFAWTLATVLVLPPLYELIIGAVRQVAGRLRPRAATGFGTADEDTAEDASLTAERIVGFVRLVLIVLGVVLVAGFWGLDERALTTLDELQIYTVRGVGGVEEYVTAADVARALLFLVATFWLLRALPGVYEFAIFPRLKLDEGLKYAILTMSRYAVFVIGFFLMLAEIHLDLGRLGWLMAAIGVGLGFGLQEIVSNFVSGVILLIERPVRPGDVVTVSGITGTVQRINIRATTIMNFDRQEVMLPNRSLITTEVTNWTRGDTMNRVIIPIGVAYGSDVDEMTELLKRIASADPDVLEDPGPGVFFMNHGESSLDFEIRLFVPSPGEMLRVRDRINKAINRELTERGIEIPFPQRDLHIRSSEVGVDEVLPVAGKATG